MSFCKTKLNDIFRAALKAIYWASGVELNYAKKRCRFYYVYKRFLKKIVTLFNVFYFYLNVFYIYCEHGRRPVLLRRLLRTQSDAFQRENNPQICTFSWEDRAPT